MEETRLWSAHECAAVTSERVTASLSAVGLRDLVGDDEIDVRSESYWANAQPIHTGSSRH